MIKTEESINKIFIFAINVNHLSYDVLTPNPLIPWLKPLMKSGHGFSFVPYIVATQTEEAKHYPCQNRQMTVLKKDINLSHKHGVDGPHGGALTLVELERRRPGV